MDESDAIEALSRLGLKTYEARVFVALQKLGTGTASDVAEITDVPRSQVYGAADDLESRGLLEVQQTRPTVYRPVSPEEAERQLLEQLQSAGRDAFDYLQSVRGSAGNDNEQSEALWTVRGTEHIRDRVIELIGEADRQVIYGAPDRSLLEPALLEALTTAAESGISVTVVSEDQRLLDRVEDDAIETVHQPEDHIPEASTTRLLLVDDDTILMSVRSTDVADDQEIAFWSAGTAFAMVLVGLSCEMFQTE